MLLGLLDDVAGFFLSLNVSLVVVDNVAFVEVAVVRGREFEGFGLLGGALFLASLILSGLGLCRVLLLLVLNLVDLALNVLGLVNDLWDDRKMSG